MMPTDAEAAYAAGILDGEGSICLVRNRLFRSPSPQVSVCSTDRELLEWLRVRFGGTIVCKKKQKLIHSQSYDWKLTDRRALEFLKLVRPYLSIRRKIAKADLLLEEYIACTPRNGRYNGGMRQRKQRLLEKFHSLP